MKHQTRRLNAFVFCGLLCTAAGFAEMTELPGEMPAPALELADLHGKQHALTDYHGKVVLVNFWASWCTPCLLEMPDLQRLADKLANRNFTLLTINTSDSPNRIREMLKRLQLDLVVLLDSDGRTFRTWQGRVLPTSFLLDRNGKLRYRFVGSMLWDDPELQTLLQGLLQTQ
jgi:thiol-disulfide isomerase/thioredoxin